ncbi:MAG TPA: helix-turn-helix transcriptional regulator [Clostridiales bacterium]|jgi:ArsR family transcriptional regulator|nr:helix-turn-helix transcriptional regulator [Clostridiales bacterium]
MFVYRTHPENFIIAADILKVLAHPQRLCIVKTLCERGESSVSEMQSCLDEEQPKVSQHLAKLKAARIVIGIRKGNKVYYSLCEERVRNIMPAIIDEFFSKPV